LGAAEGGGPAGCSTEIRRRQLGDRQSSEHAAATAPSAGCRPARPCAHSLLSPRTHPAGACPARRASPPTPPAASPLQHHPTTTMAKRKPRAHAKEVGVWFWQENMVVEVCLPAVLIYRKGVAVEVGQARRQGRPTRTASQLALSLGFIAPTSCSSCGARSVGIAGGGDSGVSLSQSHTHTRTH
jgi:hypothetical protein